MLWVFSIILESVCVLPQLLLLRQTTVPTVIDSFYLLTLGSYRAFYILNWIIRRIGDTRNPDPIAVIFGVLQTAFYLDFAWVYFTRQRVKLRNGGVVDSEDLSRGWIVGKILGRSTTDVDEENRVASDDANDSHTAGHIGTQNTWGRRGISVSADEDVADSQQGPKPRPPRVNGGPVARREELTGFLGQESDSDDEILPPNKANTEHLRSVGDGQEWRNEPDK